MQRMPSYPLWIIDPHFSVWSPCDRLTDANAQFWAGQPRRIYGFVRWNGTSYLFCGKVGNYPVLPQTDVRLSAFGTQYRFETQEFSLRVEFLSPLPPNDKELAACPVCFTRYAVERGELPADFAVSLAIHEEFCYDKQVQVTGGVLPLAGFEAAFMSRARNLVMSHMNDHLAPDWGDVYLAGAESWFVTESAYYSFLGTGEMSYKRKELESSYLVGISRSREGCFLTAFDDRVSIFYFGEWLKGYYFRNGKTIIDALTESFTRREDIFRRCSAFDKDLKRRCRRIGKGYYTLACAALRQTMGAHKLVQNAKGELLFLSRECDSNGCIGTADVSYPSMPLFLVYDPELVNAMARGIFDFARFPVWTFPFAPHDIGTYPWCFGQAYGIRRTEDKYSCGMNWFWLSPRSFSMLYLRPAASDVYDLAGQMPVEECGNMLIMMAAALAAGADERLARDNFDLLGQWADYLAEHGASPEHQLCTDDFAGHLAGNVNLSVKAMVGLEAFALLCRRLGAGDAERYERAARSLAVHIAACAQNGILPLAYGVADSYSLKYNLLFDKLFGFRLLEEFYERETDVYLAHTAKYGVPLDGRRRYTKSDWLLWCAALTDNAEKCRAFYAPVLRYLEATPSRVPFGDWYDADSGAAEHFYNRSVQGGIFAPMLSDVFRG